MNTNMFLKTTFLTLAVSVMGSRLLAQTVPQAINYQAEARNAAGNILGSRTLGIQAMYRSGSGTGTVTYTEVFTATTNQFGLFTLQLGTGTPTYGTFAAVPFGSANIYLQVGMDTTGGMSYITMGTSQFVTVPYSMAAQTATTATNSTNSWSKTGNSGTNSGSNFIGTTDTAALRFRVNNIAAGEISGNSTHNVSYGLGAGNLVPNTGNINNTAIGYKALYYDTSGGFNTAVGMQAMYANRAGNNNTSTGYMALYSNTTGYGNTAVGVSALYNNNIGNFNTGIGYASDAGYFYVNTTAIGYQAYTDASNKVRIGNGGITSISGQVSWTTTSDGRVKNSIQANVHGLDFIKILRPVTYHYDINKENELLGVKNDTAKWEGKYDVEKITFSGFIAQEVDTAAQKIGYDFSGVDKTGNMMGLRYSDFVPSLVKAVQELNAQVEQLNVVSKNLTANLSKAENENELLKQECAVLKQQIAIIKKADKEKYANIMGRLEKMELVSGKMKVKNGSKVVKK